MAPLVSRATTHRSAPGRLPAETGAWVFVVGDLTLFAVMFGAFLVSRADNRLDFAAGHASMSPTSGALMTLTLLTSSLYVVVALDRMRAGAVRSARRALHLAVGCGAVFVVLKAVEYGDKVRAEHTPEASQFWAFYFGMTGIHLVHVAVGMGALILLAEAIRSGGPVISRRLVLAEGVALFWHMVDAVWIVLFALLYLVR